MAKSPKLKIEVAKVIIFFPVAKFVSIGDVARLRIFGLPVYSRVGNVKKIFWHTFGNEHGLPEVSSGLQMPKVKSPKIPPPPEPPAKPAPRYVYGKGR